MQLTKIPMPLLIAALVATTAVVIYLQLTVVPVPAVADPNYTVTLVKGSPYLWRGAASEINITSNATIRLAYMPVAHVVYVNGPLTNTSLGGGKWLIHTCELVPSLTMSTSGSAVLVCEPLLVEKTTRPGGDTYYFVFKLVNTTKVNGLSVLVPQPFDVADTLSKKAINAIRAHTGASEAWRIVRVYTNGTHITLDYAKLNETRVYGSFIYPLSAIETTSIKITSSGYGVSYKVNATTVSAYLMPYQHIVIVPNATARVTIVVK